MTESENIKLLYDQLLQSKPHKFPTTGPLDITCKLGVYIIFNSKGVVSHVGNTRNGKKGLCQRLNNHLNGTSSYRKNFLRPRNLSVRNGFTYKLIEISSGRHRVFLESLACGLLCPEYIGTHE